MRYIDLHSFGGAEQLYVAETKSPEPKSDEVLIKVAAAGLNRPDIVQRQGHYPAPADASPILGLEVAGIVESVGCDVKQWRRGDRVCALTNGGGYAEYVSVPAGQCLPVPESLSLQQAASLPETFFTVWSNVFERADLKAGEVLLIHGGASGIGVCAIQLGKLMGCRVLVTVSNEDKAQACRELGADLAIVYREQEFVAEVKAFTEGAGANVILDMVGGDYIGRNIKAAAVEGRIVNIAYMQGAKVELNLMPLMMKRLTLTGSTLRAQSAQVKAQLAQQLREKVWPHFANKKIRPVIEQTFAFEDVAKAHRLMESGTHIGKIVLTFNKS